MNAARIVQAVFHERISRRSKKAKLNLIKRSVMIRGQSLIHKKVVESLPINRGVWWKVFSTFPASYQTKAGKRMQHQNVQELKSDPKISDINRKIGDKRLQILILYKLLSKRKRDVDNYTKNIVDSLRKGGLFKDDNSNQIKFLASKVDIIRCKDSAHPSSSEKAIVYVDFFNEKNPLMRDFNSILRS